MKINLGEKHQEVEISDKEIIIYKDNSALIGSIVVLVLVFLTGVIALKNINFPNNLEHDGIILLAFSCILTSSFFLVIAIHRFFSSREAVIINNEGITENVTMLGLGLIRWNEIKGLHFGEVYYVYFLPPQRCLEIALSYSVNRRLSLFQKIYLFLDSRGRNEVKFTSSSLPISLNQLLGYIRRYAINKKKYTLDEFKQLTK